MLLCPILLTKQENNQYREQNLTEFFKAQNGSRKGSLENQEKTQGHLAGNSQAAASPSWVSSLAALQSGLRPQSTLRPPLSSRSRRKERRALKGWAGGRVVKWTQTLGSTSSEPETPNETLGHEGAAQVWVGEAQTKLALESWILLLYIHI